MSGAVGTPPGPDCIEGVAAVQALLAGQAALDAPPDLGRWTEIYKTLREAHQAGGLPEAWRVWEILMRSNPELARLQIDQPWPERQDLPTLLSVPALPPKLLPDPLRGWLIDIATRACIPLEYVAAPAIVALGTVVGRTLGIRPSRYDDYVVVPNLWGGIIGRPGPWQRRCDVRPAGACSPEPDHTGVAQAPMTPAPRSAMGRTPDECAQGRCGGDPARGHSGYISPAQVAAWTWLWGRLLAPHPPHTKAPSGELEASESGTAQTVP